MWMERLKSLGTKRNLLWLSGASGVVVVGLIAVATAQHFMARGAKSGDTKVKAKVAKANVDEASAPATFAAKKPATAKQTPTPAAPFEDPFSASQTSTPDDRYANYRNQNAEPAPTEAVESAFEQVDVASADMEESTETTNPSAVTGQNQLVPVEEVAGDTAPNTEEAYSYHQAEQQPATASAVSEYDQRYTENAASDTATTEPSASEFPDAAESAAEHDSTAALASETATSQHGAMDPAADAERAAPQEFPPTTRRGAQPRELAAQDRQETQPPAGNPYLEERLPDETPRNAAPIAARSETQASSGVLGEGTPGDPKLEAEQGASLIIHKTGPPEVQLGIETPYEIRVENVGDAPAHNVEIRDVVPRGAELVATQPQIAPSAAGELVWSLGTLAPGEDVTVELRVIPRAEGEIGSVARVSFSADAAARTLVTRPQLELSVAAPKSVLAGERAQVFVRVTNNGTGVATGVVLEEVVPAGFEHPAGATLEYRVGTLKPRDSRELPLTLSAVKPTQTTNVVSARADGDILVEQRTEIAVVAPELKINMEGPKRRFLDRDATYTVAVSNPGTAPAQEIEVVTFLADGMEFVSADNAGQYDPQTRAVYWLLDELPPNEMGSVTVTARPTKPGEHLLRVEGHAQRGLEAIEEQPILVEGLAAVEFQVVDLADPVEINGEAAYEIVVKNGGTKASSEVELVVQLPVEMQLLNAEGPARYKAAGQKIVFEPLKSLAPGQSVSYQITAKTVDAGDARLQVKLLTSEMQSPVTKEENTKVFGDE